MAESGFGAELLQQIAGHLIHLCNVKTGSERIPNRIVQFRKEILMPRELVVDELKLADIDWRVFWSVLSKKNDCLARGVCDSQFKEYISIRPGDIGDQE